MTKNGSFEARESAANALPDDMAAVTREGQAADERERDHGRAQKTREPLHALIVHFDARCSSDPSLADQED
jgi:hypothetical protein